MALDLPPNADFRMAEIVRMCLEEHLPMSEVAAVLRLTKGQVSRTLQNYWRWKGGRAPRKRGRPKAAVARPVLFVPGMTSEEIEAYEPTETELFMAWAKNVIEASKTRETREWINVARESRVCAEPDSDKGA